MCGMVKGLLSQAGAMGRSHGVKGQQVIINPTNFFKFFSSRIYIFDDFTDATKFIEPAIKNRNSKQQVCEVHKRNIWSWKGYQTNK